MRKKNSYDWNDNEVNADAILQNTVQRGHQQQGSSFSIQAPTTSNASTSIEVQLAVQRLEEFTTWDWRTILFLL